jgi:MoaA/NifB/PqqE/SkfB family radical SAM enzyme
VLRKKRKKYYVSEKADGILNRKYKEWFHAYKPVPSFPEDIQIQTITGCNASCIFCPNGKTKNPFPQGKMEDDLYKKIIDECMKKPAKRISPYLMNEPLRDRELGWKIKYIAERKHSAPSIKLNTNASLLKKDIAEQILHSGLDRLNISFHGISKEVYEKSMQGLDYGKTLENVNNFLETKSKINAIKPKVTITMVRTKWIESEIDEIRSYWDERDVSLHIQPLENRARGDIKCKGLNLKAWQPYLQCKRLFTQAYILYNGDMVLCCVDWERTTILGNVREKSIAEVWNGNKAVSIRKKFLSGNTEGLLCHSCLRQTRHTL